MRDRHGYLERLLDDSRGPGDKKARAPHQIAWVSTPAVAPRTEIETLVKSPAPHYSASIIRTEAVPEQPVPASTPVREPGSGPLHTHRREVLAASLSSQEPVAHVAVGRQQARPAAASILAPAPPSRPPETSPAMESRPAPASPAQFVAATTKAPAVEPRPAVLPLAALKALERLAKLSSPAVQPPHVAIRAVPPAPPAATAPRARQPAPTASPVAVVTTPTRRAEPVRPSGLHIGTIEVTVTSPPTAPPPVPVLAPLAPVAVPPATRLSRPTDVYGLGQA